MAQNHAQRIASTITMCKNNALAGLSDGTFVHIHQAAQATGIPRITIYQYLNKGLSKHKAQHNH